MSILLTNSRVEGGVGLTWEAGSACLEEAGSKIIFYSACAAQATPIGCNTYSLQSDMVYSSIS